MSIDTSKIKSAELEPIFDEITPSVIMDAAGNKIPIVVAVVPGAENSLTGFQSGGTLESQDVESQDDSSITQAPNPPLFRDASGKKLPLIALVGFDSDKNLVAPSIGTGSPGPEGPAGPQGPQGVQGPQGDTGVVTASDPLQYNPSTKTVSINLAALDVVNATSRYVATNGSDGTGTGSAEKPFASVQKAVDSLASVSGHAAVYIMPGAYSGTTTITRNRTHLIGLGAENSNVNSVSIGPVVFNVSSATGGVNNDNSSICNILMNGTASAPSLYYTGSALMSLYLVNSYCYQSHSGQSALKMDITAPVGDARLYLFSSILNSPASVESAILLHITGGVLWQAVDSQLYSASTDSDARVVKLENSCKIVTADRISVSGSGMYAIEAVGSSCSLAISNSLIQQTAPNSSGVNLYPGVTFTCIQNVFDVPAGTGRCVDGSLGAVLVHSLNTFIYNNKFASAMGPGVVPLSTTPSLA